MSTPAQEASQKAYKAWNRQIEDTYRGKQKLAKQAEALEEKSDYFNRVFYHIDDILYNIVDHNDEEWKQELLWEQNHLYEARRELGNEINKEYESIEDKKRELANKEDDAHQAYEQARIKAQAEKEARENKSRYF